MTADPDPTESHHANSSIELSHQFPGASVSTDRLFDRRKAAIGVVAGLGASTANLGLAGGAIVPWLVAGALSGGLIGAVVGPRMTGPGDGLIRGLGLGVLAWILVLTGLSAIQAEMMMGLPIAFRLLIRLTLGLGGPIGLAVGFIDSVQADRELALRSVVTGAIAGVVGGIVFAAFADGVETFRFLSGLVGVESVSIGLTVHYLISATLGAVFAVLFRHQIRTLGSSLAFGFAYGLFWWLLGWLTLLPLLQSEVIAWSPEAAAPQLGSLIGHAVYGILLGGLYAGFDGIWRGLVYNPDPIHPGTGVLSVRIVNYGFWGGIAGLVAAITVTGLVRATGYTTGINSVPTSDGIVAGGLLVIGGTFAGVWYGVLFRYEASDFSAGGLWGAIYGTVWWVLGPLTGVPVLLGEPVSWTAQAIATTVPSLIGLLLYGVITGVMFTLWEQRHAAWATVDPQVRDQERRLRRPFGTAAPGLWLFLLGMTVIVPTLLL